MTDVRLPDDVAKARVLTLLLLRLAGTALAAFGLLLWRTDKLGVTAPNAGPLLFLVGVVGVFALPSVLIRRWRSTDRHP
jgi:hypothetical protein